MNGLTCPTTGRGALRGGHIPTALSVPGRKQPTSTGRFRTGAELDEVYSFVRPGDDAIAYCRIGERSSHTWFVLTHLLGIPGVRNYDGSWTEWGNTARVPIATGDALAAPRDDAVSPGGGGVRFRRGAGRTS